MLLTLPHTHTHTQGVVPRQGFRSERTLQGRVSKLCFSSPSFTARSPTSVRTTNVVGGCVKCVIAMWEMGVVTVEEGSCCYQLSESSLVGGPCSD